MKCGSKGHNNEKRTITLTLHTFTNFITDPQGLLYHEYLVNIVDMYLKIFACLEIPICPTCKTGNYSFNYVLNSSLRTEFIYFKDKFMPYLQHGFIRSEENLLYNRTTL